MNEEEIIKGLRRCADRGGCEKCPYEDTDKGICIDNLMYDAADLIESLQAQLAASQRREKAAVDTLTKLLKHANDDDDICAYCNNQIICNGKSCESYREGVGDVDGNYPDWEWTCEDFDYGTCFKMQNTPCNGCFDNEYRGFEWRGQEAEEGETNAP